MAELFHFVRQDKPENPTRPRYWRDIGIDEPEDTNPLNIRRRAVWIEETAVSDGGTDTDGNEDDTDAEADDCWAVRTAEMTPGARPSHASVSVQTIGTKESIEEAESLAMECFQNLATQGAL